MEKVNAKRKEGVKSVGSDSQSSGNALQKRKAGNRHRGGISIPSEWNSPRAHWAHTSRRWATGLTGGAGVRAAGIRGGVGSTALGRARVRVRVIRVV
jgi:hypothetical protein